MTDPNPYARLRSVTGGDRHERFYQDLTRLLAKHFGHLTAAEMLAIAAGMVGKLIALQDQRTMTPAEAMTLVASNIEVGNREVLEQLGTQTPAGRA